MDQLQQTVRDLESQGNSEKWAKASISKTQVEHVQTLEKEWSKQTKINESMAKVQQEQVHAVESQRHALEGMIGFFIKHDNQSGKSACPHRSPVFLGCDPFQG